MKYVIIGNSAAAVGCVEGIRQLDRTGEIVMISDEPYHTYGRPLISYYLLGKTDLERMKYRPDSFYDDNGVTKKFGVKAISLDTENKSVKLENGESVAYDKLLVSTGSSPFVPPAQGYDEVSEKFTFMKLDDALAIKKALKPESRVLIIGAGLIGLKCAEGIIDSCAEITVVDMAGRILSSILDDDGASVVRGHIESRGVKFILGDCVSSYEGGTARLKSGISVDFDILVTAVGVRANTSLVRDAGGQVGRGIITDDCGRTSLDSIWAAGDCSESYDISCSQNRILALLPNAYLQGESAGICMAGGSKPFDKAIPMNSIGFMGLHVMTAGSYTGDVYSRIETGADGKTAVYKKLFYSDDHLNGYILIGDVARAGIYTSLIRERTLLSSIDFDLICERPQLMAFCASDRAEKLSSEH